MLFDMRATTLIMAATPRPAHAANAEPAQKLLFG
jgi:hypothetical protein